MRTLHLASFHLLLPGFLAVQVLAIGAFLTLGIIAQPRLQVEAHKT